MSARIRTAVNKCLKVALSMKGLGETEIANLATSVTDEVMGVNLPIKEAAQFSGVSERTLYEMARNGYIEKIPIGRRVFYKVEHLQDVRDGKIRVEL